MKSLKILGFSGALVAAAILGGTLMSAAFAAPSSPGAGAPATTLADDAAMGAYCQTFLDAFAKQLGVNESALLPAAKAAADAAIDKAVADGKITKAVGDELKQRVASADPQGCGFLGRWGQMWKDGVRGAMGLDLGQAAADALKMSVADLRAAIRDGKSLKQIAADQKVDYPAVTTAIHAAAKADLDKLVKAGTITQAREDEILANLDAALKDGNLWNGIGMGHMKFGPGFPGRGHGPFGPQASASPSTSSSS